MIDPASRAVRPKGQTRRVEFQNYLFVLPAIGFLLGFILYPMFFNIQLSLRQVTTTTLLDFQGFVGLGIMPGSLAITARERRPSTPLPLHSEVFCFRSPSVLRSPSSTS